jgi:LemA protein
MCVSRLRLGARGLGVLVAIWLSGCGYNTLQSGDAQVKAAWADVITQYQQRAVLIPSLVNTVKGYAPQETKALANLDLARERVRTTPTPPEMINDSRALDRFQTAQNQLSAALSQFIAVSENYPDLKSDQNFRDSQALLESAEERISAARGRYLQAVSRYNLTVHSFPEKLTASLFGYRPKSELSVADQPAVARPPPPETPASAVHSEPEQAPPETAPPETAPPETAPPEQAAPTTAPSEAAPAPSGSLPPRAAPEDSPPPPPPPPSSAARSAASAPPADSRPTP